MKRLILLLLCIFLCFSSAIAASRATPTDLEYEEYEEYAYFEDNDPGYINIALERKVYISMGREPEKFGDTVTLTAVLVDFKPDDIVTFQWEYCKNIDAEKLTWILIEDATKQIYTFILDETNINYWYRVIVETEGE